MRHLVCGGLISTVALGLLVTVSPPAAADDTSPSLPATMTLKDAIEVFRTHGLDLLIAEANIQSAEGDVTAAGASRRLFCVINPQPF